MNNKTVKPERPGGFQDFLPADYLAREKILKTIEKVFRSFGFDPIETPRIEFLKTLAGEESDTGKQIFQVKGRSRREREELALSFDHTVPFARIIAGNPYSPKKGTGIRLPWRRMVVGPVFRAEAPQSGRYCQFYQFDADIAGTSSMVADAEIVTMMSKTLKKLGITSFIMKLNNRKILNGLAEIAEIKKRGKVAKEDIVKQMFRILDKIDKIGEEEVINQLQEEPDNELSDSPNLSKEATEKIKAYLKLKGDNRSLLDQCQEIFEGVKIAEEGIEELRQILNILNEETAQLVKIDFSIARGLDYYTGPVVESLLLDAPQFGSVVGGGRYNDLVARFTDTELPAVGASIGVDRLIAALKHLGLLDKTKTTVSDVMVLRLVEGKDAEYIQMAKEIREAGLNCEVSLFEDLTFQSQFNYGIQRGVKYLVMAGEEEFKKGVVAVKNLETRKQEEVQREKLAEFF